MLRCVAALAVLTCASSLTNAQTIYAPVQYQYGTKGRHYYYGGNDPAVFALAERQRCGDEVGDHPYTSDRYTHAYVHRRLIGQLDRVYSDCVPYVNARVFGYLAADANNAAHAGVPRYFRKADLLRAAVEQADGSYLVPAQAQPVQSDLARWTRSMTRPATRPRAILILPREKAKTSDKRVASAAR